MNPAGGDHSPVMRWPAAAEDDRRPAKVWVVGVRHPPEILGRQLSVRVEGLALLLYVGQDRPYGLPTRRSSHPSEYHAGRIGRQEIPRAGTIQRRDQSRLRDAQAQPQEALLSDIREATCGRRCGLPSATESSPRPVRLPSLQGGESGAGPPSLLLHQGDGGGIHRAASLDLRGLPPCRPPEGILASEDGQAEAFPCGRGDRLPEQRTSWSSSPQPSPSAGQVCRHQPPGCALACRTSPGQEEESSEPCWPPGSPAARG